MEQKKCRRRSNCGADETCIGSYFGLKRGTCVSTKLRCRKTKDCPKNYDCLGSDIGLKEGTCIQSLALDPLSKAMTSVALGTMGGEMSAQQSFKYNKQVNYVYLIILLALLGGIGYLIYYVTADYSAGLGQCLGNVECNGYYCGSILSGPNKCDCTKTADGGAAKSPCQGGQYYSTDTNCKSSCMTWPTPKPS